MKHTHHLFLLIFLATGSGSMYAQTNDSLPKRVVQYATEKFPFTRLVNVEGQYNAPFNYTSKLGDGTKLPDSRMNQMYQTRMSANVNFIRNSKWIFSTGLFYNYMYSETSSAGIGAGDHNLHYFATGISLTRMSTLFGKMAIYNASVIPTGGNEGFERVTGMVSATIVLKADATTKKNNRAFGYCRPQFYYSGNAYLLLRKTP